MIFQSKKVKFLLIFIFFLIVQGIVQGQDMVEKDQNSKALKANDLNAQAVVRVFDPAKQPVKNLDKSDFIFKVNGQPGEISTVTSRKQKLVYLQNPDRQEHIEPRLFVFIFNVCTHRTNLSKNFVHLFNGYVNPGDHIIVIMNGSVQEEITVEDPQVEAEKIAGQIASVSRSTREKIDSLEFKQRYLAASLLGDFQRKEKTDLEKKLEFFFADYEDLYREYTRLLCEPTEAIYDGLAQYLKGRDLEKWVFQFNQVPGFHQLKQKGNLNRQINLYVAKKKVRNPYSEKLAPVDASFQNRAEVLSRRFLNTGAVFYTIDIPESSGMDWTHYEESVTPLTPVYISNLLSRMTGGSIFNQIGPGALEKENLFYILNYHISPGMNQPENIDSPGISIESRNKNHNVIYDRYAYCPGEPMKQSGFQTKLPGDSIDQSALPTILQKVADYCKRLEAVSLSFYCTEDIIESINEKKNFAKGEFMKGGVTGIRTEVNKIKYGYRLVKDSVKDKPLEERLLFEKNGFKKLSENVSLTTRFKYGFLVFSPGDFQLNSRSLYNYRIVNKRSWHGENVWIIEALLKDRMKSANLLQGRFWVNENDFSIVRIEFLQQSLFNFEDILAEAKRNGAEPEISIILEYDYLKNGIRFPSKLFYEEAYRQGERLYIRSSLDVTLNDYIFYKVESKVDLDKN